MIESFGRTDTAMTHGGLHFLKGDKSYGSLKCVSDSCTLFSLHKEVFAEALKNSGA